MDVLLRHEGSNAYGICFGGKGDFMENFGVATVVVITVIAYLIGETMKLIPLVKNNWIPVICGVSGGCLGVVGMYVVPDFPAQDIMTAVAVGIVSGFAATGVNQAFKCTYCAGDDNA